MKSKIGFDITQSAFKGGVATYTKELSLKLDQLQEFEMIYFYSSFRISYHGDLRQVETSRIPISILEKLLNDLRLPIEVFIGEVDIYHSSDWIQPKTKAKKVTTYHDVIPIKYPEWSTPKVVAVHKKRLDLVEKEIDQVIAVSKATKQDLLESTKIPSNKITVIYEGVDQVFQPQAKEEIAAFKQKYKLPEKFILSIGGVGSRRNLDRVKIASSGENLVITGQDIWVADNERPLLYSAAQALIYPSFYEGFGLPVLEAMACGTPVVTSNVSSLPEVAGDAALLVDPNSEDQIKQAIRKVVQDKEMRRELIEKGFKQSSKFTWDKTAKETANLYKKLLAK